ncbi:hypothetical protein YC2023_012619 [Brassica napus]
MQSDISNVIRPERWSEWTGTFALNTLTYREYANKGAGAETARRVRWRGFKVITAASEAQRYTAGQFIGGGGWLGDMVEPRGWITWNPRTLRYGEYKNSGTGVWVLSTV